MVERNRNPAPAPDGCGFFTTETGRARRPFDSAQGPDGDGWLSALRLRSGTALRFAFGGTSKIPVVEPLRGRRVLDCGVVGGFYPTATGQKPIAFSS